MYSAIVGRDTSALNAVEEPMLISARRASMNPTSRRAFSGICRVGWT